MRDIWFYSKGRRNRIKYKNKIIKRINKVVYWIQKTSNLQTKIKFVHKERLAKYWRTDNEPIRHEQA